MKFQITKHTQEQFIVEAANAKEAMEQIQADDKDSSGYVENYTCRQVVAKPAGEPPAKAA